MAYGYKTGGRRKGSKNKIRHPSSGSKPRFKTKTLLPAAIGSGSTTPVEFLLAVMQCPRVELDQRLRGPSGSGGQIPG